MADSNKHPFADWTAASEIFCREAFDLSAQCLSFGRKRAEEDFSVFRKLMGCKDLTEMAECHQAFAEKATRQYIQQFNNVWNHFTDITKRSGTPDEAAPPIAD